MALWGATSVLLWGLRYFLFRSASTSCRAFDVRPSAQIFPVHRWSATLPAGPRDPSYRIFSESPWCQLSKFGRKYKYKYKHRHKYKYHDQQQYWAERDGEVDWSHKGWKGNYSTDGAPGTIFPLKSFWNVLFEFSVKKTPSKPIEAFVITTSYDTSNVVTCKNKFHLLPH